MVNSRFFRVDTAVAFCTGTIEKRQDLDVSFDTLGNTEKNRFLKTLQKLETDDFLIESGHFV